MPPQMISFVSGQDRARRLLAVVGRTALDEDRDAVTVDLRAAVLLGDELGLVDDLVDLLLGELLLLAAFLLGGGVRREGQEPDGEQAARQHCAGAESHG